jgi:hypothetical protein
MKNIKKKSERSRAQAKKVPKMVKLDTTELARVYGGYGGRDGTK